LFRREGREAWKEEKGKGSLIIGRFRAFVKRREGALKVSLVIASKVYKWGEEAKKEKG